MAQTQAYIKTIPFTEFQLWDVKRYINSDIESSYPLVSLSKLITERSEKVKLFDFPNEEFKILGVNNKIGLFDAYTELGKNINQAYKKVYDNDLAYNPYRINVGSIGWKTPDKKNDFISPAYIVFSCKEKLIAEYLYILFKTKTFNKIIIDNTTGSVRQNLKFDTLKDIRIPLPSIDKQREIVNGYNQKLKLLEKQLKEAENLENTVENFMLNKLGVNKISDKASHKGIQLVNFSEIERWDIWSSKELPKSNLYKNTNLRYVVIGNPVYGANVKGIKKLSDTRYVRITDINESGYLNNEFVSPASVDEKYLLKENDFLIARSGNTVGKTLLFKNKYGRAIYAGYLVKYNVDTNKIFPEYLFLFTKSYIFKKWIEINQRVAGQPNINGQEFLNAPVVLPPIQLQIQIVNEINIHKNKIKDLHKESKHNKKLAIQEFEKEIFNL